MPYIRFFLLCLIWGSSFILMKRAGGAFSPWAIGCGRVLTGMAVLLVCSWWQARQHGWALRRRHLPALVGVMLMGYAIPYAVQPLFISRTGNSALAAMAVGFTPLMTIAFSIPILGIKPTFPQTAGVLGSLGCLALLMVDGLQRSITGFEVMLIISVPIMYALANIWMRMSLTDIPPMELTIVCLGLSGLMLLPIACLAPAPSTWSAPGMPAALICLVILGVLGTGLGMLIFNQLLHQQGPLFAAMVTNLTPIGAFLWGWTDSERVTMLQLFALIGVLASVLVVQSGSMVKPKEHSGEASCEPTEQPAAKLP